jgi:hypothetical protein
MLAKLTVIMAVAVLFSGCASVPMSTDETSNSLKSFNPPSEGMSGLYIFRSFGFGSLLKMDIWVDGECIGESAPSVFFYTEVGGDQQHTISTESQFSPNDLVLMTESKRNYFIEQYIKASHLASEADLRVVNEAEGQKKVSKLGLAVKGMCSK